MESNQDFGSILNNFSGSVPSGPRQDSGDGLGSLLNGYQAASRQPRQQEDTPASVDEFVKSVAPAAQKVAQRLGVPVDAVIGQWGLETGWGKSVIPGTNNLGNIKSLTGNGVAATDNATGSRDKYRQYASVDEFADDFANLVGNGRYKAVAGAKDAQSYFTGLKAGGYAEDPAYVQKGAAAAQMAGEALKRVGVTQPQQASGPDLSKAPKWADVEAKPEFQALTPEKQAEAKTAYFDYWIAPRAGDRAAELRQKFLASAKEEPGFVDKALGVVKDVRGAIADALSPAKSVMEKPGVQPPEELPTTSKVPVRPEVRAAFNAAWDAATPEQRADMQVQPGWTGMLARERAGVFERSDASNLKTTQLVDPRAEARQARLAAAGEDPRFAERAARDAAAAGVMPGREIEFMGKNGGLAQPSTFDFDTKQVFDQQGGTNGLNNPLSRGVAKGAIGIGKAVTGYGEFLADTMGLDSASKTMREGGNWARGKEQAIGESGTFLDRNFEGAINSIAQQLPLLITGTKLETEAIPLAGMAMQTFGQEYSDGRAAGQSVGEATTRAAIFAAFEVVGEKFGLKESMQAIKAAARGLPSDQIIGFLWSALKKEVPGELLTTTGQFATDKLPGGVGLNQNATGADYLKQVADTVAQTIMQSGVMAGGTTGVSKAIRYTQDKGPLAGVAEADAELARQQALNKWNTNGLTTRIEPANGTPAAASTTPDGRIEPTLQGDLPVTPAEPAGTPAVHPTTQTADDIVRELAQHAGIPEATVLPTPAPQQTTGQEPVSDQDVQDFAAARYQQLREKRDGRIESVVGESGVVDQDMPGAGLSPAEQQELDALTAANNDPLALRKLYGFDQSIPSDASQFANQAQVPAPATGPVEQPAQGQQFPASIEPGLAAAQENQNVETQEQGQGLGPAPDQGAVVANGQPSGPAAVAQPAADAASPQANVGNAIGIPGQQDGTVQAQAPVTESEAEREARLEREAIQGEQAPVAKAPQDDDIPFPPPKPKTEKEARQQKEQRNGTQAPQAQQAEAQQPPTQRGTERQVSDEQAPAETAAATPSEGGLPGAGVASEPVEAAGVGKYTPPTGSVWDDWKQEGKGNEHPQYNPTPRQQLLVDAVAKALDDKLFYNADVNKRVAQELGYTGEIGDGSVFSADVYNARKTVEAKRRHAGDEKVRQELSLKAGDKLGTLVFNDFKVTNAVEVESVSDDGQSVTFKGKRGAATVKATTSPTNIMYAIDRAKEKDKRKDGYADFLANRAKPKTEKEAKAKREEQAKPVKGEIGMKLEAGQVVLTASGRETTPFPKFELSTERKASNGLKAVNDWLIRNAHAEAVSRGDNFNARQFGAVNLAMRDIPQADKDAAEEYLFGQQPAVVPSILKPLVQKVEEKATPAQESTVAKPAAAAQNPEPKESSNGDSQRSDSGTAEGSVASTASQRPTDVGDQRTPVDLAGGEPAQAQDADRGKQAPADAQEPQAATGAGERVSDRPADAARQPDGEAANGRTAADTVSSNFTITDELNFAGLGAKTKYANNVAAIRLLKQLESEGRQATAAEQAVLAKYIGWGGMPQAFDPKNDKWAKEFAELKELLTAEEYATAASSTRNAHYTAAPVVQAIWQGVQRIGFKAGAVLEPSLGSGNFFGLMPVGARSKSRLFGVEFDHITGGIAKQLYPQAKVNAPVGFQEIKIAPESFDLAIGNPPFGDESLYDKNHTDASKFKIHGFFFAKSVDTLKPGGVLAMVVSKGLMDANDARGKAARAWLAERTRLLGAIRLPNSAFQENANTEVTTDIIFLQKLTDGVDANAADWNDMGSVKDRETGEPIAINKYFVAHPDMMLGEMTLAGSMYRANEPTLSARPGDNLPDLLAKAIEKLPQGVFKTGKSTFIEAGEKANKVTTAEDVREYGYFLKDGKLFQRMPDYNGERQSVQVAKEGKELERITGMVGLRDLVRKQLALEKSAESKDADIEANRAALNKAYDAFVKKYGFLNSQTNKRLFADDSDAALVLSLEAKYDKGVTEAVAKSTGQKPRQPKASKATIFTKRVQTPVAVVTKANTAKEAMLASLNERGRIDPEFMAGLYGKPFDDILAELGDLVFEEPGYGWVPADLYLSGNVKAALAVARKAAEVDARFQRNVTALMKVQPADINPSDIFVKIGSPWVSISDYNDFAKETFGGKVTGSFLPATGNWSVDVARGTPTENNTTFGTERMGAHRIIETLMSNKQVAVYDEFKDADGNTKRVLNAEETAAAQGKADALAEAFQEWIWKDNDRRERLSRAYNDTYNTNIPRKYDGSHLSLPGMNTAIQLRPHQLNWVYRSLVEGKGLADHVVGAGKTFAIIAAMMEMRRLGLANKPMIVVPNHLVGQWAKDIMALYPGANVLAASRKDFGKDRRKLLFSRIATGDWDMVVVAHSSFGRIPVPKETEQKILDDQLSELIAAIQQAKADKGARFTVKDLEKAKVRIEAKLEKLADRKQDNALDFADLGVDTLAVDEAHEFKNLFYTTTLQGVAGLGNPQGSTRAFDMFVKTRYVSERAGGKNVFFATGTPLANSIAEVFHMQRFLQYETLKARGIHNFDAWANTFGQSTSDWEMNAAGKFVQKTRFRKFANLPELKGIWGEIADTVTRGDLMRDAEAQGKRFPLPKVKGGRPENVVTERSQLQAEFIGIPQQEKNEDGTPKIDENGQPVIKFKPGTIVYRLENWKEASKENPKEIPLAITGQARKAGLDYRLIDENAPDFKDSKINAAVSRIFDIWKANDHRKGTQLVFCDLSVPASAKGQATADAAEKVPTFFVAKGSGIEHVAGKPLTLAAMPDLQLFSHKDGKRWVITERTTGLKFADGATKQEAIDAANSRAARVDPQYLQTMLTEKAIPNEAIDDYIARWEEQQAQAEDTGSDEDGEEAAKEISLDEMLADAGGNFSVYDDIKAKLIAKGMPADQIAFIHDYNTDDKKAALFASVNAGEVRVLLGSTQKMGAGTNVQSKLVALHHMDAPWRPADLEQREGRIIRQGNEFYEQDPDGFEVGIYRYATKQTYDSRMWEIIETKARAIEQFKTDATMREIEDVSSESANAAEMKAGASGNPLILEEISLRTDLRKLQAMKKSWDRSRFDLEKKIKQAEDKTGWVYNTAKMAEEFAAKFEPKNKDKLGAKVFGVTINSEKDIKTEELASKMMAAADSSEGKKAGSYRGIDIYIRRDQAGVTMFTTHRDYTVSSTTYGPNDKFSVGGFLTRLDNLAESAAKWKDNTAQAVVQFEKDAENAKKELARGFPKADELKKIDERHKAVVAALRAGKTSLDSGENATDIKFQANENAGTAKANATESDLKNVRALNGSVVRYLRQNGQTVDDGVLGFDAGEVPGDAGIRVIAKAWGQKLQWFVLAGGLTEQQRKQFGFFNGALVGGITYLNAETDRPHLAVLGHEIVHRLRKDNPDLYDEFVDLVRPYIKPGAYKEWVENSKVASTASTKDGKHEEFMAEVGADAFMDTGFWERIGQNNPTLLGKLVAIAKELIAMAKSALGYTPQTKGIVSDYDAVMRIASDVLGRYMGSKVQSEGDEDIRFQAKEDSTVNATTRKIQNNLIQFFGNREKTPSLKTFGLYDKTLSTQYNKALKDKHFGKVFAYVNAMQNEVSLTSIRPAELAPGVLPRVDDVKSAALQLVKGKKSDAALSVASSAIFDGTLAGDGVMQGKVWTHAEFLARPGATEAAWGLYKQARDAIDASLDEVAAAEAYAMAQGFVPKTMRRQIIDNPGHAEMLVMGEINRQIKTLEKAIKAAERMGAVEQEAELKAARKGYLSTRRQIDKIFATAMNLKKAGYAPLMRFGKYTVTVQPIDPATGNVLRDENGEVITDFFGQYETEGEAKLVRSQMEAKYKDRDDMRIRAGTKSQSSHELYSGISPETLALFAEAIGADNAMRKYIELAMNERSALKRRLHRKGTRGYDEDLPRVLSNFITSNGRHAAQRYYLRDLNNAIKYIPHEKGDVLDEAMRLKKFALNPSDPAAPVSSIMFAWFLGGSVASAVINLTQPVMMTAPYLSQFGAATATKALAGALPYALGRKEITDQELKSALKRASQEGIVDAQEIFHLYSVGAQGVASGLVNQLAKVPGIGGKIKAGSEDARARINAFLTLWGSMFSLAEGFNRKLTFISAWEVAKANGEKNPYAFAVRAVNETQGIYNKINRPNWAQGPVGRTLLTFKQYSIMYVELLSRMWKRGGPEGKRAAAIMLAVLMLASGEEGLPFSQDLDDLIDTVGQMFGLDTNMRRNKRRLAYELLGKGLGDLFLYGVSAHLPLDFSGRLGLGNLIPGTGLLKPSDSEIRGRQVAEVFGPTAGMATQIGDAYDAMVEGNTGKAVQNLSPKAVKDAMAAAEMAKKGYATDSRGRKVVEVSKGDAAWKGVGFQPTKVAEETRKTMPVYQDIALQKRTESSIVNQWVRGLADNDMEMAKDAQQRLTDWNRRNPDTPIQITPDQIRNLARQQVTEKDARLLKQAPREMRGRIGLDLAK